MATNLPARQQRQTIRGQRQTGPKYSAEAHYTITDAEPPRQTPSRPQSGSGGSGRQSTGYREYVPSMPTGNDVPVMMAEYFGSMFLIFLTVFTDTNASYSSKMLAAMKRGTLATVLFFVLALFSTAGPNAAKVSKAIGALTLAGIFLGTAGQGTISVLDAFFKADWTSGDTTQGDTSGNAGAGQQQTPSSGDSQSVLSRIEGTLNQITKILNLPGFGIIK